MKYRAMVTLAGYCAMRFGEITELRRGDIDIESGVVRITRAVTRVKGAFIVGPPKTTAGRRTVTIPPRFIPEIEAHLAEHVGPEQDALLFPARRGGHLPPSSLATVFYPARHKAGRDDLRFHDLRHSGAVMAAQAGATLADLQARLGHTTPGAAMIYQHAAAERDALIAEAISAMTEGDQPIPLRTSKVRRSK
jgi:integrase